MFISSAVFISYVGGAYLYGYYRKAFPIHTAFELSYMQGIMSLLMRGASPETVKSLLDLSPYVSSRYIDDLSEMCGSFLSQGNDYTLRSFVDEFGSWSVSPVSRSIHYLLNDDEVSADLVHAVTMHQAFPDIIEVISSIKEIFILETMAHIFSLNLIYAHARATFAMGYINCGILEAIVTEEGEKGVEAINLWLLSVENYDLICCLNSCGSSKYTPLFSDTLMCSDIDSSQCFTNSGYDLSESCYYSDYFCS